jgi:hypothetical protein
MKFSSIKLLDTTHIEKMGRKYNIEEGLIVEEVCSVIGFNFIC